jgi:hypothetical protein
MAAKGRPPQNASPGYSERSRCSLSRFSKRSVHRDRSQVAKLTMAIKFICSCGKHLRARDEMAPVGIPSLRPTHSGTTSAPLTPAERQRTRRCVPPAQLSARQTPGADVATGSTINEPPAPINLPPAAGVEQSQPAPLDPGLVRLVKTSMPRSRWQRRQLEAHWYECLSYPFRAWPLVLGLAAALTALSGVALFVLTGEFEFPAEPAGHWLLYSGFLLVALPIWAYACGLLDCVLTSALAGELKQIRWPERRPGSVFKKGIGWLVSFIAGPIVPAMVAFFYWVHGGDFVAVDWMILAELLIVTVAYWLFALLSVGEKESLTGLDPVCVMVLTSRLGTRAIIAALGASVLVGLHGWLLVVALVELHRNVAAGVILFPFCWISGIFWAIFLLRLVGVWCHRARVSEAHPA